uniref:Uncharacterized protein n=1 Tax=Dromaius novaehollandiae TaxID=8790 RepID=A0A8C4KMY1_DRONO
MFFEFIATAGTTIYGVFDPLSEIADIREKLSGNCAWNFSYRLETWKQFCRNRFPKFPEITKQMAYLFFYNLVTGCGQTIYLFQPDKQYDTVFNTEDKTIQCGQRVDVFKLWLMWKAKVRRDSENTDLFQKGNKLLWFLKPEFANVCFWYIPPSLKGRPDGPERTKLLHQVMFITLFRQSGD